MEQPGDRLSSPIGSECCNALLKVISLIKDKQDSANPPVKVKYLKSP